MTASGVLAWIAPVAVVLFGLMSTAEAANSPIPIKAVPLTQLAIHPEISAPATVVSLGDSRISAELNAPIEAIPVRVGDIVEPGGILVRLVCGDYELTVAELKARLAGIAARRRFARQQLQRAQSLKKRDIVSQELVDEREANLAGLLAERDANQVALRLAERNRSKCTVRAPFRAAVLERLASVGEYATPGSPLIRVLDMAHLEVTANMMTGDAQALDRGVALIFRHGGQDYPVKLRTLMPVIDPLARSREARLLFTAEPALPGATGRLVWKQGTALPADLLVRRDGRLGVLLVADGKARFHPIPGAQEGRPAATDLPADAMVITDGRFALSDGDTIEVVD